MSVPHSALHSKVRKAAPEQRQPASCRYMPELQRMLKQHGIPLYGASSGRSSDAFCLLSVSFHSGPIESWANGDTFRFVPSVVSPYAARRKESPLCLPGRPLFVRPAVIPFILSIPSVSIPATPPVPFYPS